MLNLTPSFIDDLQDEFGDSLRVVAIYENTETDIRFIRDDLRENRSDEYMNEVLSQISLEGMGYEHFEDFFNVGQLRCAIYSFDEAFIFHIPPDPFNGLVVSIDREADFDIDETVQLCKNGIVEVK